ncbi:MAG: hypothetical protein IPJ79_13175 [Bacteroidetes bacterium]|nr:hypothetical protein [Bacteroidota bacterium]
MFTADGRNFIFASEGAWQHGWLRKIYLPYS